MQEICFDEKPFHPSHRLGAGPCSWPPPLGCPYPAASADTTLYTKAKIKLFQAKNTDSKVLCRIPKGTALSIQEKGKNWCQVTYEEQTGYVRTAKLSAKKPGGATPRAGGPPGTGGNPRPGGYPCPGEHRFAGGYPGAGRGRPAQEQRCAGNHRDGGTHPGALASAAAQQQPCAHLYPWRLPPRPPLRLPRPLPPRLPLGPSPPGDPAQVGQIEELDGEILDDLEDTEDQSGMQKLDKTTNKAKDWSGQIVLGEGGLPIPQLYQHDYKKVVCVYNGIKRSVSTSGCGATCLSMLIAYETGYTYQSPYTVFRTPASRACIRAAGSAGAP